MKGKLRYVAIVLGGLVLILMALPFFVSANSFRPTIEERLSSALGRKVHVGNLSLSIFSGALSAEDLSIADDPKFSPSPFLTAKSFKVEVELWPLITSKTMNVTGLAIEKPEISLIRGSEGQWNYSTLASSSNGPPSASTSGGAPPDFKVARLELKNGRITVGSAASDKKSVYDNVNMELSNVSLKTQFPVKLTADLPGGGGLKLEGRVGPVHPADTTLSPLDVKVTLSGLDLAKTGFLDPSAGIAGILDVSNTLQSSDGRARARGSVKMNKLQLVKGGAPAGVPVNLDFGLDYDLRDNTGVLTQGIVKIGSAVARLAGTFDRRGESTVLNMKLDGQNMPVQDLEAVLPALGVILPKGSSLKTGTLNANLNCQGPADKLVTTGNVGLFNAKLAGFDMASKLSVLSSFSGTQGSQDTSIQKLTSNVRVAPEGIQTSNLEMVVPAIGQLTGGGTISSNSALNMKMVALLTSSGTVGASLGGLTGRGGKNTRIPFLVQGTTSDPKIVPDVGGMVGGVVESQLGDVLGKNPQTKGLTESLQGLFGKKKKNK